MKLRVRPFKQTGDTLVEVLIAVAVISSVLAGAFLVSQKSARAVRSSQEHSEMLQVLQGQVELVRSLASAQTDDVTGVYKTSPKFFCIDPSNPTGPKREDFASDILPAVNADTFATSFYNTKCMNLQNRYNVAISYDPSSKIFNFVGRWSKLGGGNSQEQLSYRIYPGKITTSPLPPPTSCTPTIDFNLALDTSFSTAWNLYDWNDTGTPPFKTSYTPPYNSSLGNIQAGCKYAYELQAADASHPHTPVKSEQPQERIAAYFYKGSTEVAKTDLTDDWPDWYGSVPDDGPTGEGPDNFGPVKTGTLCFSDTPDKLTYRHHYELTGVHSYSSVQPYKMKMTYLSDTC